MFCIRKFFKDPKMYYSYTNDKQAYATLISLEEIEAFFLIPGGQGISVW